MAEAYCMIPLTSRQKQAIATSPNRASAEEAAPATQERGENDLLEPLIDQAAGKFMICRMSSRLGEIC